MKKLNLAIIGQGRSGYSIHGKYLLTENGKELFNVVAVVDYAEDRRKRAAEEFGCDTYEDYRELFKRNDIDFVVASTFSNERYPVVMDLINHKFNVIAEKPFSKYSMECERMIKAAKENGVKPVTHKEVSNGLLLCTVGIVEYCSKNLILNFGGTTMKSIFEQNGGTYIKVGKYYIPNVLVPDTKKYTIGKYGRMHAKFIKENRPCI